MISSSIIKGFVALGTVGGISAAAYIWRDNFFGFEEEYLIVKLQSNSIQNINDQDQIYDKDLGISKYYCQFESSDKKEPLIKDEHCSIYKLNSDDQSKKFDISKFNNDISKLIKYSTFTNEDVNNFFVLKINKKQYEKIKNGSPIKLINSKDNKKIFGSFIGNMKLNISDYQLKTNTYIYSIDHKIESATSGDVDSFKCLFLEEKNSEKQDCEVFIKNTNNVEPFDFSSDQLKKLDKSFVAGNKIIVKFKNKKITSEEEIGKKTLKVFGPNQNDELFVANYNNPLIASDDTKFIQNISNKPIIEVLSELKPKTSFIVKIKTENTKTDKLFIENKKNYKCKFKTSASDTNGIEDVSCEIFNLVLNSDLKIIKESSLDNIERSGDFPSKGKKYFRVDMNSHIFENKEISSTEIDLLSLESNNSEALITLSVLEKIHSNKLLQEHQYINLNEWKANVVGTAETATLATGSIATKTNDIKCLFEKDIQPFACDIYEYKNNQVSAERKKITSIGEIKAEKKYFLDLKEKKRGYRLPKKGEIVNIGTINTTQPTLNNASAAATSESFVKKGSFKISELIAETPNNNSANDCLWYIFDK